MPLLTADDIALLDAFATHETAVLGYSPNTVGNHRTYLTAFLTWWRTTHGPADPRTATPGQVSEFLVAETARGLHASTRASELAALRRMFAWLRRSGVITVNPATDVPRPRIPPPRNGCYSPDEVEAILAHTATLRDVRGRQRHAIVATLRYTGVRSLELRSLRLADVDLVAGRATVLSKNGRHRPVLLPAPLLPVLTAFVDDVRPLLPDSPLLLVNAHEFVTTPLSGFGQEALAREVELAGLGAGVPGPHYPHKWRHTFATELIRAGVALPVAQRLLGHVNIASTIGYTHLVLDDLRDAVQGVWQEPDVR